MDLLERREVKFVVETMAIVLRQDLMRLPSLVVKDLRCAKIEPRRASSPQSGQRPTSCCAKAPRRGLHHSEERLEPKEGHR